MKPANLFSDVDVISILPDCRGSRRGDKVPDSIIGSEIVRFGTTTEKNDIEGGGLFVDYLTRDTKELRRVVFGFNELGMWVEYSN